MRICFAILEIFKELFFPEPKSQPEPVLIPVKNNIKRL